MSLFFRFYAFITETFQTLIDPKFKENAANFLKGAKFIYDKIIGVGTISGADMIILTSYSLSAMSILFFIYAYEMDKYAQEIIQTIYHTVTLPFPTINRRVNGPFSQHALISTSPSLFLEVRCSCQC